MYEDLNKVAMNIILHAGNARTFCMNALDFIAELNFEDARKEMEAADREIIEAHRVHTEVLQKAVSDEKNEYTILFAHAQDTLMSVNSEILMTKKIIAVTESLERKISEKNKERV